MTHTRTRRVRTAVFAIGALVTVAGCASTKAVPPAAVDSPAVVATATATSATSTATSATPIAKSASPNSEAPASATVGALAPGGTFTAVDGSTVDVASFRGKPTVLWFVAAGCSSCVASIPAVADHLQQLQADGVHVVVIDLYGDLGEGAKGAAALRKFGTEVTGQRFTDPGWTWGTSSKELSFAYDGRGEPDVYYILDRTGKIAYRNGVPISTMNDLLSHAHTAAAQS